MRIVRNVLSPTWLRCVHLNLCLGNTALHFSVDGMACTVPGGSWYNRSYFNLETKHNVRVVNASTLIVRTGYRKDELCFGLCANPRGLFGLGCCGKPFVKKTEDLVQILEPEQIFKLQDLRQLKCF